MLCQQRMQRVAEQSNQRWLPPEMWMLIRGFSRNTKPIVFRRGRLVSGGLCDALQGRLQGRPVAQAAGCAAA